jgi:hypothetical protein
MVRTIGTGATSVRVSTLQEQRSVLLGVYTIIRRAGTTAWLTLETKGKRTGNGARNVRCCLSLPEEQKAHVPVVVLMIHLEAVITFSHSTKVKPRDKTTGNGATNVRVSVLQEMLYQGNVRQEVTTIMVTAATIHCLLMEILVVARTSGAGVPNASC